MSNEFCSKFHTLSSSAEIENRLRFDNVTESLKVGTFLRHNVDSMTPISSHSVHNILKTSTKRPQQQDSVVSI